MLERQGFKGGDGYMGIFDPDEVITEYSIREAVEMGALVEVFKDQWGTLSGGKPIVASANVFEFEGEKGIMEVWNRFFWQKFVCPTLPPEKASFFSTEIGIRMIWVFDDRVCFTIIYPEDY
jgi:hypothetical protein